MTASVRLGCRNDDEAGRKSCRSVESSRGVDFDELALTKWYFMASLQLGCVRTHVQSAKTFKRPEAAEQTAQSERRSKIVGISAIVFALAVALRRRGLNCVAIASEAKHFSKWNPLSIRSILQPNDQRLTTSVTAQHRIRATIPTANMTVVPQAFLMSLAHCSRRPQSARAGPTTRPTA